PVACDCVRLRPNYTADFLRISPVLDAKDAPDAKSRHLSEVDHAPAGCRVVALETAFPADLAKVRGNPFEGPRKAASVTGPSLGLLALLQQAGLLLKALKQIGGSSFPCPSTLEDFEEYLTDLRRLDRQMIGFFAVPCIRGQERTGRPSQRWL